MMTLGTILLVLPLVEILLFNSMMPLELQFLHVQIAADA